MWVDIASQTQIWQPCIPQDRADLLKQLLWVYETAIKGSTIQNQWFTEFMKMVRRATVKSSDSSDKDFRPIS